MQDSPRVAHAGHGRMTSPCLASPLFLQNISESNLYMHLPTRSAFLLYHWMPFDKSIYGKLRDPFWWLLKLVTLIPFYGASFIAFPLTRFFSRFPSFPGVRCIY